MKSFYLAAALLGSAVLLSSTAALAATAVPLSHVQPSLQPTHFVIHASNGAATVACEADGVTERNCTTVKTSTANKDLVNAIQVNFGIRTAGATWVEERDFSYQLCALDFVKNTHCTKIAMPRLVGVSRLSTKKLNNGNTALAFVFDSQSGLNKQQTTTLGAAFRHDLQKSILQMKAELDTVGVPTTIQPLIDTSAATEKVLVTVQDDCPPVDMEGIIQGGRGTATPMVDGCGGGGGDDGGGDNGGGGSVGVGGGGDVSTDPACADACYNSYEQGAQSACNALALPQARALCWAAWAAVLAACLASC